MKKTFLATLMCITSICLTPTLFSQDVVYENNCCDLPKKPFAHIAPKDLALSCENYFYTFGEFLWMKPKEQGLDYAILATNKLNEFNSLPLHGGEIIGFSSGHHTWKWNPGFRIGGGANIGDDGWSLSFTWCYLRMKDDTSNSHKGNGYFVPLFFTANGIEGLPFSKDISARWKGDYNTIDFMLDKSLQLSSSFVLTPNIALRSAFIDQDFTVRYSFPTQFNYPVKMLAHNNFWGIGPRAGLNSDWIINKNLNLYAGIGFSLLFGTFDMSQVLNYNYNDDNWSYDINWDFWDDSLNTEIFFGINWKYSFNKNRALLNLKFGYETLLWLDQNRLTKNGTVSIQLFNEVAKGNLSFNGIHVGAHIDF